MAKHVGIRTVATILAHFLARNLWDESKFKKVCIKKGVDKEDPSLYKLCGVGRVDPAFTAPFHPTVDTVLWLGRMYTNMRKKDRVPNWVRPADYPITEQHARDVWFYHRGLDPITAKTEALDRARSIRFPNTKVSVPVAISEVLPPTFSERGQALVQELTEMLSERDTLKRDRDIYSGFLLKLKTKLENLGAGFQLLWEELSQAKEELESFQLSPTAIVAGVKDNNPPSPPLTDENTTVPKTPMFLAKPGYYGLVDADTETTGTGSIKSKIDVVQPEEVVVDPLS